MKKIEFNIPVINIINLAYGANNAVWWASVRAEGSTSQSHMATGTYNS